MTRPLSAFRRPAVLLAALVSLANAVVAQTTDAPPDQVPEGARLASVGTTFSSGSLAFNSGLVGFASGLVTLPSGLVAAPAGTVAASDGGVSTGGMTVKEEKGGLRFTLNADLLFDFDKADLRPEADPVLSGLVAQVGTRMPGGRYRVEGHTDAKGNDGYNDALSTRRAKSVQAWLTRRGKVPVARITTAGLGKRQPVAPNQKPDGSDDPEGRQRNRRVEILVLPKT